MDDDHKVVPLIAAILAVMIMSGVAYAQFALVDGVAGAVLPIFFPDTTIYAAGYSETAFKELAVGMNASDVIRRIGPPLERDVCDGLERWRYSVSRSDSHYRVRELSFSEGRLSSKSAYYYVD